MVLTTLEESQGCSEAGSTAAQKFKPSEKTGDDAHGPLQHEQDGFLINDKVKIGTDSLVQSADESSPADQMITVPSAEAPDDEEFTAAVKIQAAQRRKATRKRLLQQLFERLQEFDADKNGFVDSFEMKAYLKGSVGSSTEQRHEGNGAPSILPPLSPPTQQWQAAAEELQERV
eukprot:SAG31_NODE_32_length_32319_cov_28.042681_24_plen_174_part_00